ncbi:hypothetical protein [uncultured Ruminococcus sp.]|uniref:hypothetical protein n=1 Tax=uncultured Ruminococcus sp. TaxID=165186 RepID=UPI0025F57FB1|nr:hypothetical protein [uncultured Ruminococcus sp.]
MKGYIRKAAAFLAAALVAVFAAGCADKKEDEHDHGHNMAGVSAPDGDYSDYAEKELKPESSEAPVFITFRSSFAEDEEAVKVAEFYYAMSEKSVEYLEKSVQPDVLKMKLDSSTSADYLNVQYDFIKDSVIGSDFKFTAVTIDDSMTGEDAFNYYDSLLAKAAPDLKPTSKKVFKVNCLYDKGDGGQLSIAARLSEKGMNELEVAVYTIDGKPYIIF